jgi:hypothetical protein
MTERKISVSKVVSHLPRCDARLRVAAVERHPAPLSACEAGDLHWSATMGLACRREIAIKERLIGVIKKPLQLLVTCNT